MDWYEEDFYNEPSEFEIAIEQFKATLMKSVKDEYVAEMERLRKENEELQDVKRNFEKIKSDYITKERQLEFERNNIKGEVRRERLGQLMKDCEVVMYRANTEYIKPPKCSKCNEKRKIAYKTPLGKDAYEDCECNKSKTVYCPQEYIRTEFKINGNNNGIAAHYKVTSERNYDWASLDSSTYAKTFYTNELKYDDIERYSTFFKSKEECQLYCDWLNKQ
jgi:hypothetical protein